MKYVAHCFGKEGYARLEASALDQIQLKADRLGVTIVRVKQINDKIVKNDFNRDKHENTKDLLRV